MKLDEIKWDRLCSIFDCRQRIQELRYYIEKWPRSENTGSRLFELRAKQRLLDRLESGKEYAKSRRHV